MPRTQSRADHYRALGLAPGATLAEVKRAFRALAQEHHPDVSGEPEAATRFREISEAYAVLCQTSGERAGSKRRVVAGSSRGRTPEPAAARVTLDYLVARQGTETDVEFRFERVCTRCRGAGNEPGATLHVCPACRGQGRTRTVSESAGERRIHVEACSSCDGTGVADGRCTACSGRGTVAGTRTVRVAIPAGVADRAVLHVPRAGHVDGAGGAADARLDVRVGGLPDSAIVRAAAGLGIIGALALLVLTILS